ncbi:hypothetical protein COB21_03550 [Candidatus Aerophobetes bacterium]|uniref:Uncharacterized protein n=1 Tax=Aerophobetes bacterium TaxID=2030807 RepID=A0A2A4X2Z1_UNCAE|nr:MAG: hypothetical protein COB21_03550 [Candidatus Aerophobetes bacterium]
MAIDELEPTEQTSTFPISLDWLTNLFTPTKPVEKEAVIDPATSSNKPASPFKLPSKPVSLDELKQLFPNLTPAEEIQMDSLFSKSFLYEGTPASQFAQHLDSMMQLTQKMRMHVEKQIKADKAALDKIVHNKIEHNKAFLEHEKKAAKWEWTKNILDCISLTLGGISLIGSLTTGPAAPPVATALQASLTTLFSVASLILRMKKPEYVKMNLALSTLSFVTSTHLWLARPQTYEHLIPAARDGWSAIGNKVNFFCESLMSSTKCLVGYKKGMSEKGIKEEKGKVIIESQKMQKKSDSISDNITKHTITDKHYSAFIQVATAALEQLNQMKKKTNQGGR